MKREIRNRCIGMGIYCLSKRKRYTDLTAHTNVEHAAGKTDPVVAVAGVVGVVRG